MDVEDGTPSGTERIPSAEHINVTPSGGRGSQKNSLRAGGIRVVTSALSGGERV